MQSNWHFHKFTWIGQREQPQQLLHLPLKVMNLITTTTATETMIGQQRWFGNGYWRDCYVRVSWLDRVIASLVTTMAIDTATTKAIAMMCYTPWQHLP